MSEVMSGPKRRASDGRLHISLSRPKPRERRSGQLINRIAPRHSRLQFVGLLGLLFSVSTVGVVLVAAVGMDMAIPDTARITLAVMVAFSLFALALGSVEQRLIEIRLELMMVNGGGRRSDHKVLETDQ